MIRLPAPHIRNVTILHVGVDVYLVFESGSKRKDSSLGTQGVELLLISYVDGFKAAPNKGAVPVRMKQGTSFPLFVVAVVVVAVVVLFVKIT